MSGAPTDAATRRCRTCRRDRATEDFPIRGKRDRKRRPVCRECLRTAARERRARRRPELQAYDRRRHQEPARREAHRDYVASYRRRPPARHAARRAVTRALKAGTLVRLPCEVCGNPLTQAHHDDHFKPLPVRWLCFRHHRELHGQVSLSGWETPVKHPAVVESAV